MLDGGDAIILFTWLNKKSLKCTINNDMAIKLPDYLYVLVNRVIVCNCELEAEERFLLDSFAACSYEPDSFKMYLTINLAFINYFDNWTDSNLPSINIDITEQEQTLPLTLQDLNLKHSVLMERPILLRDFIIKLKNNQKCFVNQQRIFICNTNYLKTILFLPNYLKFSFYSKQSVHNNSFCSIILDL